MRILSMTATFGKLNHETIRFDPELAVIEKPNEWGKSTWCAFITAMLYGIDSRQRTTDALLADKERYKPWSGAPMAGRMDIDWNGRLITIERQSKGRTMMNQFRAFDTQTGAEVTELTADNCGQVLLGVEKEVFLRSAFIKQSDLPVSDSHALRVRLNALVTTGDDSGAAEALSQKLKDLKNKCRHNKTGLLPEAERQRAALDQTIDQLHQLQTQQVRLTEQLESLQSYEKQLLNHQAALAYAESLSYTQKLAAAQSAKDIAQAKLDALEEGCKDLPTDSQLEQKLYALRQLRAQREDVQMLSQMLPNAPQMPMDDKGSSLEQAKADFAAYSALSEKGNPLPFILAAVLIVLGAALFLLPMPWLFAAAAPVIAGVAVMISAMVKKQKQNAEIQKLLAKYPGISPENWINTAQNKANIWRQYESDLRAYQQKAQAVRQQMQQLKEQTDALTGGMSIAEFEHGLLDAKQKRSALNDARRELVRSEELLSALQGSRPAVPPPTEPDELTFDARQTARLLSDTVVNRNQLQQRLGECQGQMAALGQEAELSQQLSKLNGRIARLEQTYNALTLAQEYLENATRQLQQRFAPRISQRAQAIMHRLTDGRYDRLYLGSDFSLNAGAQEEDTLHTAQWRSDGTMDQLYFALRLAVAEELTPTAPLILDDAFVRFDDDRLSKALALLKEESVQRQVLIFTCQSRERRIL